MFILLFINFNYFNTHFMFLQYTIKINSLGLLLFAIAILINFNVYTISAL